jgi:hypothetical protein
MGLDEGPLIGSEGAGLVENGVGNGDLADVVEIAPSSQDSQRVSAHVQTHAELHRHAGRPLGVTVGVGVFDLDRLDQNAQCFGIAVDEMGELVVLESRGEHAVDGVGPLIAQPHGVGGTAETEEQKHVIVPPRQPAAHTDLQ